MIVKELLGVASHLLLQKVRIPESDKQNSNNDFFYDNNSIFNG